MKEIIIDLNKLVNDKVDSLTGRDFGESEAKKNHIIDHIKNGNKIVIVIDEEKVRSINDSFIKGFFSDVFKILKTKTKVEEYFTLQANEYYKRLFDKNLSIIDSIYNV